MRILSKKVSDEQLLEALLVHGGAGRAADALHITPNAIYKRLQNPDFRAQFHAAQGTIIASASAKMSAGLGDAVTALVDVLNDRSVTPAVRVQAASTLLNHCQRYVETSSVLQRLDALEQAQVN